MSPGVGLGLLGRVGELHAAGLHPAAGQHLGLDHGRAADVLGDLLGLLVGGGEPVLGHGNARGLDQAAAFVLEEAHRRRGSLSGQDECLTAGQRREGRGVPSRSR